ncbi:MAG: hypothetical protein MJK14_16110 [Rivularia sp. ALOHA_DT_140]|nr:hypothetical protein [Rivularia sp. ALOHA_DT_140]
MLACESRVARLDATLSFLPELLALRKLLGMIDLHGSREECSIFSNDSIFSKIIPAKNYFRHDSIFSKIIPAKNITFGMIFGKSPENGDFEIWLVGPKFHQIFKPIRLVTSQKKIKICQNIDAKL